MLGFLKSVRLWRNLGFIAAYALVIAGVTAAFWSSNGPSADQVSPIRSTLTESSQSLNSENTDSSFISQSAIETATKALSLPEELTKVITLSENRAYGIKGSAVFTDPSTVVIRAFQIIGRGPKVQIELRDIDDQILTSLRDITKMTLNKEDLVLAVPKEVVLNSISSIVITAPDYDLVLSRAKWK